MFRPRLVAVAEVGADRLRQERDGDDDVGEAVRAQQLEDVLHARLADDRHHRLRLVRGQRPQARSLAARHHDGLHATHLAPGLERVLAERRRAPSASPVQKIQSGHSVALVRDHHEAERRSRAATSPPCRRGSPETRSRGPARSACRRARRDRAPGSAARATAAGRHGAAGSPRRRSSAGRRAGRRTCRSRDSTCQRRARKPSTWSVTPATPKTIAAGHEWPPSHVSDQHDEDRDQHEPRDRQRIRHLGAGHADRICPCRPSRDSSTPTAMPSSAHCGAATAAATSGPGATG